MRNFCLIMYSFILIVFGVFVPTSTFAMNSSEEDREMTPVELAREDVAFTRGMTGREIPVIDLKEKELASRIFGREATHKFVDQSSLIECDCPRNGEYQMATTQYFFSPNNKKFIELGRHMVSDNRWVEFRSQVFFNEDSSYYSDSWQDRKGKGLRSTFVNFNRFFLERPALTMSLRVENKRNAMIVRINEDSFFSGISELDIITENIKEALYQIMEDRDFIKSFGSISPDFTLKNFRITEGIDKVVHYVLVDQNTGKPYVFINHQLQEEDLSGLSGSMDLEIIVDSLGVRGASIKGLNEKRDFNHLLVNTIWQGQSLKKEIDFELLSYFDNRNKLVARKLIKESNTAEIKTKEVGWFDRKDERVYSVQYLSKNSEAQGVFVSHEFADMGDTLKVSWNLTLEEKVLGVSDKIRMYRYDENLSMMGEVLFETNATGQHQDSFELILQPEYEGVVVFGYVSAVDGMLSTSVPVHVVRPIFGIFAHTQQIKIGEPIEVRWLTDTLIVQNTDIIRMSEYLPEIQDWGRTLDEKSASGSKEGAVIFETTGLTQKEVVFIYVRKLSNGKGVIYAVSPPVQLEDALQERSFVRSKRADVSSLLRAELLEGDELESIVLIGSSKSLGNGRRLVVDKDSFSEYGAFVKLRPTIVRMLIDAVKHFKGGLQARYFTLEQYDDSVASQPRYVVRDDRIISDRQRAEEIMGEIFLITTHDAYSCVHSRGVEKPPKCSLTTSEKKELCEPLNMYVPVCQEAVVLRAQIAQEMLVEPIVKEENVIEESVSKKTKGLSFKERAQEKREENQQKKANKK